MNILITGSSGLIGTALTASLQAQGHAVVGLRRGMRGESPPFWDPENGVVEMAVEKPPDAVIHLAGESIAKGRWNQRKKTRILDSRVRGTSLLAEYFAASAAKPRVFISASAVGIYGDRGNESVDENSPPGTGFLAAVCRQWEAALGAADDAGIRVVAIRLGVVLSPKGGALRAMLPPFRVGLGGTLGSGEQGMSWVTLDDVTSMIEHVIESKSLRGPVNLVSPHAVTHREFTVTLGRVLRRPTWFSVPALAARLVFGEMADELLLAGVRVVPTKLQQSGYVFRHPVLGEALTGLLRQA